MGQIINEFAVYPQTTVGDAEWFCWPWDSPSINTNRPKALNILLFPFMLSGGWKLFFSTTPYDKLNSLNVTDASFYKPH